MMMSQIPSYLKLLSCSKENTFDWSCVSFLLTLICHGTFKTKILLIKREVNHFTIDYHQ